MEAGKKINWGKDFRSPSASLPYSIPNRLDIVFLKTTREENQVGRGRDRELITNIDNPLLLLTFFLRYFLFFFGCE